MKNWAKVFFLGGIVGGCIITPVNPGFIMYGAIFGAISAPLVVRNKSGKWPHEFEKVVLI
ncbi:hypothetical protein A2442_01645 [Candidatus Campbellbacteria bacterium RIFOXYC2_FULL_35_25]|uniref:Uncharacterized protein n=1 Tax=Candidatus Campbellbacteria bacterium RIFOXYC2_FULL_35_25 TaxID=1797582 RepID=A0A1F5EHX7_9BACT|nr:MAG: hypothetical protein A2442_01645 [Candidatus Campbellbacteria bacterium RIFOXYC2_FULL_35_25]